MSSNIFIPGTNTKVTTPPETATAAAPKARTIARLFLIALCVGLPLFFIPNAFVTLGFSKVIFAVVLIAAIGLLSVIALLQAPRTTVLIPLVILPLWLCAAVAVISGLLSDDSLVSLRGRFFETQTAGFMLLLSACATVPLLVQGSQRAITVVAYSLAAGVGLVLVYAVARITLGADWLQLGTFSNVTVTPLGSFSDLAVAAGACLIGIVTYFVIQKRTLLVTSLAAGAVVLLLVLLSAVNFIGVWWLVGIYAAAIGVYLVLQTPASVAHGWLTQRTIVTTLAFVTAIVSAYHLATTYEIIANPTSGTPIQRLANIDHAEVRPSFTATLSIMEAVYQDSILLGVGPNQFSNAWRQHKNPELAQTAFWNTDFSAGYSYVFTQFIQLGVLGGGLLLAFYVWFLYAGWRVFGSQAASKHAAAPIVGVVFAVSVFMLVLSCVYVPSAAILLVTAVVAGITLAGLQTIARVASLTIPLQRKAGSPTIGSVLAALLAVLIVVYILYLVVTQYQTQASINRLAANDALTTEALTDAYNRFPDDRFLVARTQLLSTELQRLIQLETPSEADQQRFLEFSDAAVVSGREAVAAQRIGTSAHVALAGTYNLLAIAGVPDARTAAIEILTAAQERDPGNPELLLLTAQIHTQAGDIDAARADLRDAIAIKPNYAPALVLITEIEIAAGNLPAAIERAQTIVRLEPRNPTRYFQLGMLYMANEQLAESEAAYRAALSLDARHANARYMLAQLYIARGDRAAAIEALEVVRETNEENEQLTTLLNTLRSSSSTPATVATPDVELSETDVVADGERVESGSAEETELVTPVTTSPDASE